MTPVNASYRRAVRYGKLGQRTRRTRGGPGSVKTHGTGGARPLRRAHVERLMHYYHLIQPLSAESESVSSSLIAELLEMDDTLVRKDLAAIGVRGCPRVGYACGEVLDAIRKTLGFEEAYKAVLVGAGRLGGAIAAYPGFGNYGLTVVAVLDVDPAKVGGTVGGRPVQLLDALPEVLARHAPSLAILTVPAEEAQAVAERLVEAGIRAIWNFAPVQLAVPPEVHVRHEHLSTGFAELAYHLRRMGSG